MQGLDSIKEELIQIKSNKWGEDFFPENLPAGTIMPSYKFACDKKGRRGQGLKYAYHIYILIDSKIRLIDGYLLSDREFEEFNTLLTKGLRICETDNFRILLKRYKPQNFKDVLFLLDRYISLKLGILHLTDFKDFGLDDNDFLSFFKNLGHKVDCSSGIIEIIESIVEDSNGYILWDHQLESILSIFIADREKVRSLVRQINSVRGKYPRITDKPLSLSNVMGKQMPNCVKFLNEIQLGKDITLADFIDERMGMLTVHQNFSGAYVLYNYLKICAL